MAHLPQTKYATSSPKTGDGGMVDGKILTPPTPPRHSTKSSLLLSELKGGADFEVFISEEAQTGSPGGPQVRHLDFF